MIREMRRRFRSVCRCGAVLLATLIAAGTLSAAVNAADYFSGIDDLPLPETLSERADESVVFETPEGRIVTVVARGRTTADAVRDYYRSTLPALGWMPEAGDSFVRDGEMLVFAYDIMAGEVTVRIRLLPTGRK